MFEKGSILFPKSGQSIYKNYRCILGEDAFVTSHIAVITISKKDKIKNRYLYELLKQVDSRNLKVSSGCASLNISDIENIKVPVPPIEIQEK
ncbi:Type I restriction modification DNA specificity domain (plasmid) [Mesomycoplasma conjunctivae]|nr:Type I restriction modification DNA specificity domain [Mesomycoplasma conjunctivae]